MVLALAVLVVVSLFLLLWAVEWNDRISRAEAAEMAVESAIGATVEPLDRATAELLSANAGGKGLVVTSLLNRGPAARAGLRPGDVIERIGKTPVGSAVEGDAALKGVRGPVEVRLIRHGLHAIVRLPIRSAPAGGDAAELGERP